MNGADVIRKAVDCGYSVVEKDGAPALRGPQPVNPPMLLDLCKSHRTEIVEELRRRKEGQRPKAEKPSSKELQTWVIALLKSERAGMAMIDGVPVGIHCEAESLLSDASAWEGDPNHRTWLHRAAKLRSALEWPVDDED